MQRPLAAFLVVASALLSVAAADEKPKQSITPQKSQPAAAVPRATTIAPTPTGFDVAIVGLSSTGPEGTPANILVATFENRGSQPLDQDLFLEVYVNGQFAMLSSIHVRIQPGARQTWTNSNNAQANLYPWGAEVRAKIDSKGTLREDNEQNNELTQVLRKFPFPHPGSGMRP